MFGYITYIISDRLFDNDSCWCLIYKKLPIRYPRLICFCSNVTAHKNRAKSLKRLEYVCTISVSNILYDIIYILVMHDSVCTRSNEFSHQINLVMQLQLIVLIIRIHRLRYGQNIDYIPVMWVNIHLFDNTH